MKPLRLAILGSTRGTNLVPIVAAIHNKTLNAEIVLVLSNKTDAGILAKAQNFGLEAIALPAQKGETREAYDHRLLEILKDQNIDLIVLIGFMRILSPQFIAKFKDRIINVHPSLLPKHKGLMDLAVHKAVLDQHETESGCSVHLVTDKVDSGKILVQKHCKVAKNDTAETLKARVQALEGPALIEALGLFSRFAGEGGRRPDEGRKAH